MKLAPLFVIYSAICLSAIMPLHGVGGVELAGRNPALSYWQAAAQLPALSDAQAKRLNAVADGKEAFGEDVLDGLEFGATMTFLRKAAASEADCDWGLAWEDAAEMTVPHLSKVRELSSITLVLAEAEFAKGDAGAGIEYLRITHRIARDAGAGANLIGSLVQNVIEGRAIRKAGRHCMRWNAGERAAYLERFLQLPDLHPVSEAIAGEGVMVDWFEREVEKNGGEAAKHLGIKLGTPTTVAGMIAGHREMLVEAEEILEEQGEVRRLAAAGFLKRVEASKNPLVRMLMPNLAGLIRSEDKVLSLQAMLKIALEHGADLTADDVAGTPFTVLRKEGKLQSTADAGGVTLRFGAPE